MRTVIADLPVDDVFQNYGLASQGDRGKPSRDQRIRIGDGCREISIRSTWSLTHFIDMAIGDKPFMVESLVLRGLEV